MLSLVVVDCQHVYNVPTPVVFMWCAHHPARFSPGWQPEGRNALCA